MTDLERKEILLQAAINVCLKYAYHLSELGHETFGLMDIHEEFDRLKEESK